MIHLILGVHASVIYSSQILISKAHLWHVNSSSKVKIIKIAFFGAKSFTLLACVFASWVPLLECASPDISGMVCGSDFFEGVKSSEIIASDSLFINANVSDTALVSGDVLTYTSDNLYHFYTDRRFLIFGGCLLAGAVFMVGCNYYGLLDCLSSAPVPQGTPELDIYNTDNFSTFEPKEAVVRWNYGTPTAERLFDKECSLSHPAISRSLRVLHASGLTSSFIPTDMLVQDGAICSSSTVLNPYAFKFTNGAVAVDLISDPRSVPPPVLRMIAGVVVAIFPSYGYYLPRVD